MIYIYDMKSSHTYIPRPSKPWKIVGYVLITWLFKGCDGKTWFLLKYLGSSIVFLFYPVFTCLSDITWGSLSNCIFFELMEHGLFCIN